MVRVKQGPVAYNELEKTVFERIDIVVEGQLAIDAGWWMLVLWG